MNVTQSCYHKIALVCFQFFINIDFYLTIINIDSCLINRLEGNQARIDNDIYTLIYDRKQLNIDPYQQIMNIMNNLYFRDNLSKS